jgi:hypothetical protein
MTLETMLRFILSVVPADSKPVVQKMFDCIANHINKLKTQISQHNKILEEKEFIAVEMQESLRGCGKVIQKLESDARVAEFKATTTRSAILDYMWTEGVTQPETVGDYKDYSNSELFRLFADATRKAMTNQIVSNTDKHTAWMTAIRDCLTDHGVDHKFDTSNYTTDTYVAVLIDEYRKLWSKSHKQEVVISDRKGSDKFGIRRLRPFMESVGMDYSLWSDRPFHGVVINLVRKLDEKKSRNSADNVATSKAMMRKYLVDYFGLYEGDVDKLTLSKLTRSTIDRSSQVIDRLNDQAVQMAEVNYEQAQRIRQMVCKSFKDMGLFSDHLTGELTSEQVMEAVLSEMAGLHQKLHHQDLQDPIVEDMLKSQREMLGNTDLEQCNDNLADRVCELEQQVKDLKSEKKTLQASLDEAWTAANKGDEWKAKYSGLESLHNNLKKQSLPLEKVNLHIRSELGKVLEGITYHDGSTHSSEEVFAMSTKEMLATVLRRLETSQKLVGEQAKALSDYAKAHDMGV